MNDLDKINVTQPPDKKSTKSGRLGVGDEILGRYVVISELGQGAMGVVYKCLDKVGRVEVAVKGLPPDVSHNSNEMDEILENFNLVNNLRHSAIAGVRTLEQDSNGDYYLIMDVAKGKNLNKWIKEHFNDDDLEAKLSVLEQIADALDYAHSQRIMHRDMKPENVMVDENNHVYVLDFGLAARIYSSISRASMHSFSTSGTPAYKSPEQWRGQRQGAASDQYSLGIIAYKMFSGDLPFDSDDKDILRKAVLEEPVAELDGLPEHINKALVRALAKDPKERFACCKDFVTVLRGGEPSEISVIPTHSKKVTPKSPEVTSTNATNPANATTSANVVTLIKSKIPHSIFMITLLMVSFCAVVLGVCNLFSIRSQKPTGEIPPTSVDGNGGEERRRIQEEEEAKRKAAEEAQRKRIQEEEERKAVVEEAKRIAAAEAERKRIQEEEDAKRIAAAEAERKRIQEEEKRKAAAEAERKRIQEEEERKAAEKEAKRKAAEEEKERLRIVKEKVDSGAYDYDKDNEGRKIAVWVSGRIINGRKTGLYEGSWLKRVDCQECDGSGTVSHSSTCNHCSGEGIYNQSVTCTQCDGSGYIERREQSSSSRQVRVRCPAGCGQIQRNGNVLFSNGFVCDQCNGQGMVNNPNAQLNNLIGNVFQNALLGHNRRGPMPPGPRGPHPPPPPQQTVCPKCNGLGGYRCATCSGDGYVLRNKEPEMITRRIDCSRCSGTGKLQRKVECGYCSNGRVTSKSRCTTCDGEGRVWKEE